MVVAKIMQAESRDASLLASYAEVQLILCKNTNYTTVHEIPLTFQKVTN